MSLVKMAVLKIVPVKEFVKISIAVVVFFLHVTLGGLFIVGIIPFI